MLPSQPNQRSDPPKFAKIVDWLDAEQLRRGKGTFCLVECFTHALKFFCGEFASSCVSAILAEGQKATFR